VTVGERIEHARRLAAELGLPLDGLDRLAVPPRLAARLLSVSHSQVEKLVARGELPAFRVGRSVRIELVELVDFMDRNRRTHKDFRPSSTRARAIGLIEGPR
jgi:excisionase family DNA binding protein